MNTTFLDACLQKKTPHTPVWYMRQAGRYIPEYRKLKETYTILEICKTPELAAQVAMQPIEILGVDAAILFADIMIPLLGVGIDLDIVENIGPVIKDPIHSLKQVQSIRELHPEQDTPYLLKTIEILKGELKNRVPLIGFSAAPFTLASYMIEGKPTRDFIKTKTFMYTNTIAWELLMNKLSDIIIIYLKSQINAGVQALQIFDSWVGCLNERDYQEYVLPYTKRIFESIKNEPLINHNSREQSETFEFFAGKEGKKPLSQSSDTTLSNYDSSITHKRSAVSKKNSDVSRRNISVDKTIPLIHFGTNTAGFLTSFSSVACDVVSIDWRISIDKAWKEIGYEKSIQGNLDPVLLLSDFSLIKKRVDEIFASLPKREGYIFNLGHGVLPQTPVENIKQLTEYVHQK